MKYNKESKVGLNVEITTPSATKDKTDELPFKLNFKVYEFYKNIQVIPEVKQEVVPEVIPEVKQEIVPEVIQLIKSSIPSIIMPVKQLTYSEDLTFKGLSYRFPFEYGDSKKVRIRTLNEELKDYLSERYMSNRIYMNKSGVTENQFCDNILNVEVNYKDEIKRILLLSGIFIDIQVTDFNYSMENSTITFEVLYDKTIMLPLSVLQDLKTTDKNFIVKDTKDNSMILLVSKKD